MDSSQASTWTVHTSGRRQELTPIDKQLLSDLWSAFGVVLAKSSQNKLIWLSYAVLLFVVEWRQNNMKHTLKALPKPPFPILANSSNSLCSVKSHFASNHIFGGVDKDLLRSDQNDENQKYCLKQLLFGRLQ